MARSLRIEYPGAFYHVMSRGNDKKPVFVEKDGYAKLLDFLNRAFDKYDIAIHAYCILPNHYHLLIETAKANLSQCMQFINTGYAGYHNWRYSATGHVFQGRYKGILIEKETYFRKVSQYIHLNPVESGLTTTPEDYKWSSYQYFLKEKNAPPFLDTKTTFEDIGGKAKYQLFIANGLKLGIEDITKYATRGNILGSIDFIDEIEEKYTISPSSEGVGDRESREALSDKKKLSDKIIKTIDNLPDLPEREKEWTKIYFLNKFTDHTFRNISQLISNKGITRSAISQKLSYFKQKIGDNRYWVGPLKSIEDEILQG